MKKYLNKNQFHKFVLLSISCLFLFLLATAQESGSGMKVSGKVINIDGESLSGVQVYIDGYSSAFTNDSGTFTINVPSLTSTLQFEVNGYAYNQLPLKGKAEIVATLYKSDLASFHNIVVLPLTKEHQSNSVMATGIISEKNSNKTAAESIEPFFQGKVAGLEVISHSGALGSGANMLIRGYNSLFLNNQPLIIVDGVFYDNSVIGSPYISNSFQNVLSSIDIKDIQSISVIKDAASIYGAKASNGVIIITTKHTNEVATRINFSAYGGMNFKPDIYPVLDAENYKPFLYEMLLSSGRYTPQEISAMPQFQTKATSDEFYTFNKNTAWQKEILNNNISQNYYLGITGGDDVAKYNLSVGYADMNGTIKNTDFSRFNTRFNSDISFTKRLLVNVNLAFSVVTRNIFDDGPNSQTSPLFLSLAKAPYLNPYKIAATGETASVYSDADYYSNPLALVDQAGYLNKNNNFLGSANVKYTINNNLNVSTSLGLNFSKIIDDTFLPESGLMPDTSYVLLERSSNRKTSRLYSLMSETKASYRKNFSGMHDFSADLGCRVQLNNYKDNWASDYNSADDNTRSQGSGIRELVNFGGSIYDFNWVSLFSQFNYSFKKKYFLSLVMETDGSSKYGKEADGISLFSGKFGLFPSVGAAWLISSENFMDNIHFINLLKLRLSYGVTGNDGLGHNWARRYYSNSALYDQQTIVPGNLLNAELKWETVKKINTGLDIAMFGNRVNLNLDFYRNVTSDMILPVSTPSYAGSFTYYLNAGSMENKGFEANLSTRVINSALKWDLGVSFAMNKNKITELYNGPVIRNIGGAYIVSKIGAAAGLFKGYRTQGVFSSQQEASEAGLYIVNSKGEDTYFHAGDMHFVNIDNSSSEINEADMDIIGNPHPDFTGGFSTTLTYKGLTLDALFTFSKGNDIYNYQRAVMESMTNFSNQTQAVMNRWRVEGQTTNIPKATFNDPMGNSRFSDRWIEDGSFLKLKTITLSYNLPFKLKSIKDATLYVSGSNLFTFTDYKGFDPEFSMTSSPIGRGIDFGLVPLYKSVIVGINLGL